MGILLAGATRWFDSKDKKSMLPKIFLKKPLKLSSEMAQSALDAANGFHDGILVFAKINGDVLHLKFEKPYFPAEQKYCAYGIKGAKLEIRILEGNAESDDDLQALSKLCDRAVFQFSCDLDENLISYMDAGIPRELKVAFDANASYIEWF